MNEAHPKTEPKPYVRPNNEAVHGFFGLTYATHLVLPRVLLQSMPGWWQAQFVALMDKYYEAVANVEQPAHYDVTAATEHLAEELTEAQMQAVGVTREWVGADGEPVDEEDDGEWRYYDKDGDEIDHQYRVLVPCADPLPHYNRGRAIVPLNEVAPIELDDSPARAPDVGVFEQLTAAPGDHAGNGARQ